MASACSFGAQSAASASEAAAAAAGGEEDLWTVWGKIINDWDANGGRRSRQMPQIKVRDFHIKKNILLVSRHYASKKIFGSY